MEVYQVMTAESVSNQIVTTLGWSRPQSSAASFRTSSNSDLLNALKKSPEYDNIFLFLSKTWNWKCFVCLENLFIRKAAMHSVPSMLKCLFSEVTRIQYDPREEKKLHQWISTDQKVRVIVLLLQMIQVLTVSFRYKNK